jgi:ribosomal silencing factor RsfS
MSRVQTMRNGLMDYVNVVVHVFQHKYEYYNIENLWEMQNHCIANKY